MEDVLVPLIVFSSITAIVIFIAFVRYRVRLEMIKKGPVNFTGIPSRTGSLALLLGLFGVAVGLAFFITALVQFFDEDIFTVGIFWILGGGALLAYWRMTAGDREQACTWYEQLLEMRKGEPQIEA